MGKRTLIIFILFLSVLVLHSQERIEKYYLAEKYFNENNYAASLKLFNDILQDESIEENIKANSNYFLAECLRRTDQKSGAISQYEYFINNFFNSAFHEVALFELGKLYYYNDQYVKSRDRLQSFVEYYPKSKFIGEVYYFIAASFMKDNYQDEAEKYFINSINYKGRNSYLTNAIYSLGILYETQGDFRQAISQYEEILSYYKNSFEAKNAIVRIGICYFQLGDYDSAVIELSDKMINELPESLFVQAKIILGNSFFRLKEFDKSYDVFNQLLKKNLDNIQTRQIKYTLAWIYYESEKFENAFGHFNDLAKTQEDTIGINSFYYSGQCKKKLGDKKKASQIFIAFQQSYPDHPFVQEIKFGGALENLNNKSEFEAEKSLLITSRSKDDIISSKSLVLLGEVNLKKNKIKEARKYFIEAKSKLNDNENDYLRSDLGIAICDFYLGKYKNAQNVILRIIKEKPNFEKEKTRFYLAEISFNQKEFQNALKYYNQVNSADEKVASQVVYGKAYSYFNLKDYPNSSFFFMDFIKKYPKNKNVLDAKLRLADSYFGIKDFSRATTLYQEIFSSNKSIDDFAYYQFGQSLFQVGKYNDAMKKFVELQEKFPKSEYADKAQYLVGWINFQQGYFTEASIQYKKIFAKYKSSSLFPVVIYSIGDCYYNLGNYDSALVYYKKLLEDYPQTRYVFDAINGINYSYIGKNEPQSAITEIDNFIKTNSQLDFADEVFYKKGEIYYSLADYQNAAKSFNEFTRKYPKSKFIPDAYYWIGKSSTNAGNIDDAVKAFNYVTQNFISSKYGIDAVIELGKLYASSNQFKLAAELYKDALSHVSEQNRIPEIIFELALTNIELQDYQEAYQNLNEIINYYPENIFSDKAKIEISILEMARNKYEQAIKYLSELSEKRLDDIGAEAQYLLGAIYFEQNNIEESINSLVRVRSVFGAYDVWYTKSLLLLGDCYIKINDKISAKEMYTAVAVRHANDEYGKEAKKKLKKL